MTHPRAEELAQRLRWNQIDLGLVVEVDLRLRVGNFGAEEARMLLDALERSRIWDINDRQLGLVEDLYLHLQATGWVKHSRIILIRMAKANRRRAISLFASKGAEIINQNGIGAALLHECVGFGVYRVELLDLLLRGGADINEIVTTEPVREGQAALCLGSPLACAVRAGDMAMFEKLLNAGADIHWKPGMLGSLIYDGIDMIGKVDQELSQRQQDIFKITCRLAQMGVDPDHVHWTFGATLDLEKQNRHDMVRQLRENFAQYSAKHINEATATVGHAPLSARVRL